MKISDRLQQAGPFISGVEPTEVFALANDIILLHNRAPFMFRGWLSGLYGYDVDGAYFIDKNPRRTSNRRALSIELTAAPVGSIAGEALPETTVTVTDFRSQIGEKRVAYRRYSIIRETGRVMLERGIYPVPITKGLGEYKSLAIENDQRQDVDIFPVIEAEFRGLSADVVDLHANFHRAHGQLVPLPQMTLLPENSLVVVSASRDQQSKR